jgi:molybdopterin/thiamine biosynthesis adenylyltransferase
MAGGFGAWKRAGLAIDKPFVFTQAQKSRYSRHLMLPEVGEAGQAKLLRSKVLLLGAGGLGAPAGLYLAAAGIGTIGLVDDDVVDESNLQRQVIHNTTRLGTPKVDSAAKTIEELNPDVRVQKHQLRLTSENVLDVIGQYDLIVDGTDNFQTRYLLNDASLMLRKPVVNASIYQFEGQVTVFKPFEGPCYRCLYPEPPPPGMAPSCNEAGVLGVLPGVIGVLQATEAVKLILGVGKPLVGRLLQYDALNMKFREFKLPRDKACVTCSEPGKKIELVDYEAFCSIG